MAEAKEFSGRGVPEMVPFVEFPECPACGCKSTTKNYRSLVDDRYVLQGEWLELKCTECKYVWYMQTKRGFTTKGQKKP